MTVVRSAYPFPIVFVRAVLHASFAEKNKAPVRGGGAG